MSLRPPPKVPPTGDDEADIRGAHTHSIDHRDAVLASELCGCFHCLVIFAPARITDWTDDADGTGRTALCPDCGIDAVVPGESGYPLTRAFLKKMRTAWFG